MDFLNEKLKEYYNITIEIEKLLDENEYENINLNIDKRQAIIDSIDEKLKNEAYNIYIKMGINKLDNEIRKKISENLEETKQEIKKYRNTKVVNSMYSRNSKEKINIFSKKV